MPCLRSRRAGGHSAAVKARSRTARSPPCASESAGRTPERRRLMNPAWRPPRRLKSKPDPPARHLPRSRTLPCARRRARRTCRRRPRNDPLWPRPPRAPARDGERGRRRRREFWRSTSAQSAPAPAAFLPRWRPFLHQTSSQTRRARGRRRTRRWAWRRGRKGSCTRCKTSIASARPRF